MPDVSGASQRMRLSTPTNIRLTIRDHSSAIFVTVQVSTMSSIITNDAIACVSFLNRRSEECWGSRITTAYVFFGINFNPSLVLLYLYEAETAETTSPEISDDVWHTEWQNIPRFFSNLIAHLQAFTWSGICCRVYCQYFNIWSYQMWQWLPPFIAVLDFLLQQRWFPIYFQRIILSIEPNQTWFWKAQQLQCCALLIRFKQAIYSQVQL